MDETKHECGVAAVSINTAEKQPEGGVAYYLFKMLLQLQNRGQLAAGIATYNEKRRDLLKKFTGLGTVNKVFKMENREKHLGIMNELRGSRGIGHTRYATFGSDDVRLAQPFERPHGKKNKWFALAFNGNIANFSELKKMLSREGYHFSKNNDAEIIQHLIAREMEKTTDGFVDIVKVFSSVVKKLDGGFNIVFLSADGTIIAFRDPNGFRPLVFGRNKQAIAIASESVALQNIGIRKIQDIRPGALMIIRNQKIKKKMLIKNNRKSHCMFEWVYFANAASKFDHVSVYKARWRLGVNLAGRETLKIDKDFVIVPVPDTAKPVADAYASEFKMPVKEGLIRNRHVGRTFIESGGRKEKIRNKYTLNEPVLKGKKIILIDDSIVRGNTSKELIEYVREARVKEVHLRVACPPIFSPCFYGIDMSTMGELIANQVRNKDRVGKRISEKSLKKIIEKIRKRIGADSLAYNSINDLVYSLKQNKKQLCLACLNSDYPTGHGKKLFKRSVKNFKERKEQRTYEY